VNCRRLAAQWPKCLAKVPRRHDPDVRNRVVLVMVMVMVVMVAAAVVVVLTVGGQREIGREGGVRAARGTYVRRGPGGHSSD
jgi:hypothetical protein